MNTVIIQQKIQICPAGTLLHDEIMLLGSEIHLQLFFVAWKPVSFKENREIS